MSLLSSMSHKLRQGLGRVWQCCMRLRGVELGKLCVINGKPVVTVVPGSQMTIGSKVTLNSSVRCNPLGTIQPCVIRTLTKEAKLSIGEGVGISGASICAASKVSIGEGTIIGSGAMIMDTDFHTVGDGYEWLNDASLSSEPIDIGKGVFIGARAIILKGVNIGDRAIVGAGSLVTKDVPEGRIVGGNPARLIGSKP